MRIVANRPDGAGDPPFRVEQATDQDFDKGSTGTRRHDRQEKGDPFREQTTHRGGEKHEGASERGNSSVVAVLPMTSQSEREYPNSSVSYKKPKISADPMTNSNIAAQELFRCKA